MQGEATISQHAGTFDLEEIKRRLSVADVLRILRGIDARGNAICCPLGHEDKTPSFSIYNNGTQFKCHGKCGRSGDVLALHSYLSGGNGEATRETIEECARLAGVSATAPAVAAKPKGKGPTVHATPEAAADAMAWGMDKGARESGEPEGWTLAASWTYHRADGTEAGRVLRFENGTTDPDTGKPEKTIRPLAKVAGGWRIGKPEGGFPLYRLRELLAAPADATVYVCEGEKATDALAGLGLPVTTCAHGAKSADKADWSPLAGRRVAIVPDNDEAGQGYADTIARAVLALEPPGKPYLLELPDLPPKGDAWEFIEDRRTDKGMGDSEIRAEVEALAAAAPPLEPPPILPGATDGEDGPEDKAGEIVRRYGKPVTIKATGENERATVNEYAAAGSFFASRDIIREPETASYYEYQADTGLWAKRAEPLVHNGITEHLGTLLPRRHWVLRTDKLAKAILSHLAGLATRPGAFEERPENAVHVANGMLFLGPDGPELRPFAKDYHSRNRTNIAWEPGATCPRFLAELLEPALPPDDIALIQRYLGQCLLGRNPSQTFLVLRGTAGGGKGTLSRVIEAVVGRHNVGGLRVELLDRPFELLNVLGRTLLVAHDVPGDFLDSHAAHNIKKLVGGDSMAGEVKGGNEPFEIRGQFNIIITTNTRLRVKLDSDAAAWERRLLLVDYERPKPERSVPDFDAVLVRDEGPGILQWAVSGAMALLAELDEGGRIKRSPAQVSRVSDLLTESDSVRAFVTDCIEPATPPNCQAVSSPVYSTTTAELSTAYVDYCDRKGWEPQATRKFENAIRDVMRDIHRAERRNDIKREGKNNRGYYSVRLRSLPGDPPTTTHGDREPCTPFLIQQA